MAWWRRLLLRCSLGIQLFAFYWYSCCCMLAMAATSGNLLPPCPEVAVVPAEYFDFEDYMAEPWYVQQQSETRQWPNRASFRCIRVQFSPITEGQRPTKMGYTLMVHNQGQDATGIPMDDKEGLCGYQPHPEEEPAKFGIAPCHLPTSYSVPYWVIAYEDGMDGYSLVSGGQPESQSNDGSGTCHTGDKGLWILTRSQERNDTVVEQVRVIARAEGFDLSVLHDVKQNKCSSDDR